MPDTCIGPINAKFCWFKNPINATVVSDSSQVDGDSLVVPSVLQSVVSKAVRIFSWEILIRIARSQGVKVVSSVELGLHLRDVVHRINQPCRDLNILSIVLAFKSVDA